MLNSEKKNIARSRNVEKEKKTTYLFTIQLFIHKLQILFPIYEYVSFPNGKTNTVVRVHPITSWIY